MVRDTVRQLIVLIAAASAPLSAWWLFGRGESFESRASALTGRTLIEPAGWAFSIWGPIYAACMLLALRALLPAQRARALHRATAWPLSIALAGATLWQWAASRGWMPATVVIIVAMALALGTAYVRLQRFRQLGRADGWLVLGPVSIFFGWLTVACFANLAALLVAAGVLRPGLQEAAWTVVLVATAGALACVVLLNGPGNVAFAAPVLWAFAAITAANTVPGRSPAVAAAAAATAAAVVWAMAAARRRAAHSPAFSQLG